jgi:hypothetical protein
VHVDDDDDDGDNKIDIVICILLFYAYQPVVINIPSCGGGIEVLLQQLP